MELQILTPDMMEVTKGQDLVFEVEAFLEEGFEFRRNVINGKLEMRFKDEDVWRALTDEMLNTIVIKAREEGVGGDSSPRKVIEEYLHSMAVSNYNPIANYLDGIGEWDGSDHVSSLFNRLPGVSDEMKAYLRIWLRSMVAHWLQMDTLHGNECVPVLIGEQGCGKSTFCNRLLPPELRSYFFDHISFSNRFDLEMALTHALLVNIDEFNVMTPSQMAKLKQNLSKVKVNSRPIFGRTTEDRPRYSSFIATTNERHPLCDPTGSRRFLCIEIPSGEFIDNESLIDYAQLYAQILHELSLLGTRYWFTRDEENRIQELNSAFMKTDDIDMMIASSFDLENSESQGQWMSGNEVVNVLCRNYSQLKADSGLKLRLGKALRYLGCKAKHTKRGQEYLLSTRK